LETMTVPASTNKVGWPEFKTNNPPIVHYYLKNTYTASLTASALGSCGGLDSACFWFDVDDYSYNENDVFTMDAHSGLVSYKYTGAQKIIGREYVTNVLQSTTIRAGSITNSSTGEWDYNFWDFESSPLDMLPVWDATNTVPTWTSTTLGYTSWGSYAGDPTICYNKSYTITGTGLNSLSSEYTDQLLNSNLNSELPDFPDVSIDSNWNGNDAAFYTLDCTHYYCSGCKMKYRFHVCGGVSSQKGLNFKISWTQVTTFPPSCSSTGTNQPPTIDKLSEVITANGDQTGQYGTNHDVCMPTTPCFITETGVLPVQLDNSSGGGGPGGPGGPHGGPGGGGPTTSQ